MIQPRADAAGVDEEPASARALWPARAQDDAAHRLAPRSPGVRPTSSDQPRDSGESIRHRAGSGARRFRAYPRRRRPHRRRRASGCIRSAPAVQRRALHRLRARLVHLNPVDEARRRCATSNEARARRHTSRADTSAEGTRRSPPLVGLGDSAQSGDDGRPPYDWRPLRRASPLLPVVFFFAALLAVRSDHVAPVAHHDRLRRRHVHRQLSLRLPGRARCDRGPAICPQCDRSPNERRYQAMDRRFVAHRPAPAAEFAQGVRRRRSIRRAESP